MEVDRLLLNEITDYLNQIRDIEANLAKFANLTHKLKGGMAFYGFNQPLKDLSSLELKLDELRLSLKTVESILEKIKIPSQK